MSFWVSIYLGNLYIYICIYIDRSFTAGLVTPWMVVSLVRESDPQNDLETFRSRIYFINCPDQFVKNSGGLTGTSPPILAKLLILFFLFSKATNLKSPPKKHVRKQESATDGTKFAGSSSQGLAA